uniref:Spindle assembly checkpoint component MAD1 n=1 Tax=Parastrongyloides trichosuri TaxID=131310 RepID=A0A0N4ZNT2_PARTI
MTTDNGNAVTINGALHDRIISLNDSSRPPSRSSISESVSRYSTSFSTRKRPFAYSSGSEKILTSRYLEAKEEIIQLKNELKSSKTELESLRGLKKENTEKVRLLTLDVESLKYELEREKSKKLIDNEKLSLKNDLREYQIALGKTTFQLKKLETQIEEAKRVLINNRLWNSKNQREILKKCCYLIDDFKPSRENVDNIIKRIYDDDNGFNSTNDLQDDSVNNDTEVSIPKNVPNDSIVIYKTKFVLPECSLNSYEETICSQRKKLEKLDNDYAVLKRAYNKEKERSKDVEMLTVKCNRLECQLEISKKEYECLSKETAELRMGISKDVFRDYTGKTSFKTESDILRKIVEVQVENKRLKKLLKENSVEEDENSEVLLHLKDNLVVDAQKEFIKEQIITSNENNGFSSNEKQKLIDEIKKWKETAEKRERERDAAADIVNNIKEFRKIVKSLIGYDIKVKNNVAELVFSENSNDVFQVQFDLSTNNYQLLHSDTIDKVKFSLDKYLHGKKSLACFLAGAFIELYHSFLREDETQQTVESNNEYSEEEEENEEEEEYEEYNEESHENYDYEEYNEVNNCNNINQARINNPGEIEEIVILSDDE